MSGKAKVLLFGSGGVGTMAAYALETGGQASVTAVLRSNYSTVQADGFSIVSVDHGAVSGWRPSQICSSIPEHNKGSPFDFIVVATKNIPDSPPSLVGTISAALRPGHTVIVLLQNGLNIEQPFTTAFPSNPVISGISYIGASEQPPGTIRHDVHDELVIGPFDCPGLSTNAVSDAAERFARLYSACSEVTCRYDADTRYWRWRKLIYNTAYNSVAAITGLDVSRMRFSEHVIEDLVRPIMLEIIAIAAAEGTDLTYDLVQQTIVVDPFEAFFLPSMGQDAAHGNLTEFENIVGEPLRVAERLAVPAPTLRVVYSLLKALQWRTKEAKGQIAVPMASTASMRYG